MTPDAPEFTDAEALAFIESMRLTVDGRVGFKWMVARLGALATYVAALAGENARTNAFIDSLGARADYEAFREPDTEDR